MDNPKVSVIIPAYRVAAYLRECVDSVLAQTFGDFEVILVDDGSPDETGELCDRLSSEDSRIRVVHKQNEGLGFARNTGVEHARGEWILFLDGDDCIDPQTLETTLCVAERDSEIDQVRFLFRRFPMTPPEPLGIDPAQVQPAIRCGQEALRPILAFISTAIQPEAGVESNASGCGAIYRATLFSEKGIRFHSERELISEDYVFNLEAGVACRAIAYTAYPLYNYRHNPASLSTAVRADRIDRTVKMCEFMERRAAELGVERPSEFAMGLIFGPLRTQLRHIFNSNHSTELKRAMFRRSVGSRYIKRVLKEYPLHTLPRMQYVLFRLHVAEQYTLCRLLTTLRDRAKK